jgi:primosomal protein N' (replication factor Y)
VLLDADLMLARAELRAGEEALRRWLEVVAKVRPASAGGTVLVVGQAGLREVQALVRLDPVGYADTELAQRAEAGFPPAIKLVTIEGALDAVSGALAALEVPEGVAVLGPFGVGEQEPVEVHRLTLRCPLPLAAQLVGQVKAMAAVRAARKDAPVRVRVDPQVVD